MSSNVIAERYELVNQIGQGGMGQIWEGFDHSLRRAVAIKLMVSTHLQYKRARARFSREAMAIATIQSPHVVQVFDAGVHEDCPYIVMELLSGEDLHARLGRVDRLSLSALVPIITQVARALEAAKARNIVHRDLKPANIFLARTGAGEEVVKILDFGVVAMLSESNDLTEEEDLRLTTTGDILGTPHYMSPEQVRTGAVDFRTDLWSLAVLAYRALTGVHPFHAEGLGPLLVAICTDPFVPPSVHVPELSKAVDDFFNKALAKDPNKRFATAGEFAAAFVGLSNSIAGSVKILVTDDEPDVATIIRKRFRKQIQDNKYQFVFANDGEDALRVLRDNPDVEVVLTDINMPRMDGLTFLAHLGAVNPLARAVVVSAYSELTNIRTAMNRGAFDFLVKPIDFKDLTATLDKTLKHVAELRKGLRSNEENNVLRMSVSPRFVERVHIAATPRSVEHWPCTAVVVGVGSGTDDVVIDDPREYVRMLNSNLEVIIPGLMRRGGVIDRFVGSEVVALFRGENHAQQALDGCWDVRTQLQKLAARTGNQSPFGVGVAIGVATGEMIAAEIGSRAFERIDDALLGETPKWAAKLRSLAQKNQILVSPLTRELTRKIFEFDAAVIEKAQDKFTAYEVKSRIGVKARPADMPDYAAVPDVHIRARDTITTMDDESSE